METYPEFLYKYRSLNGTGKYRHIEGNLYEDTTCKGHPSCRIRVKPVGDHFEFESAENESAVAWEGFHKYVPGDSHYYADPKMPNIAVTQYWIDKYHRDIVRYQAKIDEAEDTLSKIEEIEVEPQVIQSLDFGASIFLLKKSAEGDKAIDLIAKKVQDGSGLISLITACGREIVNAEDGNKFMEVREVVYDYAEYYREEYFGFSSESARDAFKHNQKREVLVREIQHLHDEIEWTKKRIAELEAV